mgnify:CR=1 FL=1
MDTAAKTNPNGRNTRALLRSDTLPIRNLDNNRYPDPLQRELKGLPDSRVVLEPFAEGNHNYLSEDAATAAALDKALRETTVAFLVEYLK